MIEDIIREREKKRSELKKLGKDPYPATITRTHSIGEVLDSFADLSKSKKKVAIAGRVMGWRVQGGVAFADLRDENGKIQTVIKKDNLADFELLKNNLDIGDFLAVEGPVFKTQRGEKSVEAKKVTVAVKALRPLPSVWHGLKEVEERFRKRYLDTLLNADVKEKLAKRSEVVGHLRSALAKEGFLEVETPILQPIPGGATARPFKTHHNALDVDFYLRVAPELYLKRLLVGGFEKVFEIGRNFRNEGIDRDHNPEFTMLELYWAYQDCKGLMKFVEKLLKPFIKGKFKTVAFSDLIKNWESVKPEQLDEIFKKEARPKIKEPTFVTDYPEVIMPLAKLREKNPKLTESFQLIVNGSEIVKGFSELNDPVVQRAQMERQEKEHRSGNEEVSRLDEDFLEALEYGMPPAAGLGLGIDRLVTLVTGAHSVKEIIAFPTLRPKE
ncbi:MAG: lysine--tRNA ligase [Candidatus Harrisonbacteria bacterium]|nr:lysine--tRNA ligase [Candidatus Harrisonbacteria bacterium]